MYFLCKNCNPPPPEKSHLLLSKQPPSKSWGPVKPTLFENLVGGSPPLPPSRKGGGGGCATFVYDTCFVYEHAPLLFMTIDWDVRMKKMKKGTLNWIVDHFSLTFVNLSLTWMLYLHVWLQNKETCLEPCQISKIVCFAKRVNG